MTHLEGECEDVVSWCAPLEAGDQRHWERLPLQAWEGNRHDEEEATDPTECADVIRELGHEAGVELHFSEELVLLTQLASHDVLCKIVKAKNEVVKISGVKDEVEPEKDSCEDHRALDEKGRQVLQSVT